MGMDDFDDEGDDLLAGVSYNFHETYNEVRQQTSRNGATLPHKKVPDEEKSVKLPQSFPFPFEPYSIQHGFMTQLYTCLELGKIGIFESPTGTGKSLSLICGALRWLKDYQEKQRLELEALTADNSENQRKAGELDWITEFSKKKEKEEQLQSVIQEQDLLKKQNAKAKDWRSSRRKAAEKRKQMEEDFDQLMKNASDDIKIACELELEKIHNDFSNENSKKVDEDECLVADYESDDDRKADVSKEDDYDKETHVTKIYYCSRTHSQLSQFVREVIKSPYGEETRVITLGSRQNLCINENVKKLKNMSLINDACLDMQKSKKETRNDNGEPPTKRRNRGSTKCPFYKPELMEDLKDQLLMEVMDMEQIVSAGKKMKGCPYYGTRYGIPLAEIVALPYNILLHKSTREACGIQLQGNIVLVDEAHNLLETINNIHSVEVSGAQLLRAHSQLTQYETRYRSRLKAKNLMYIKQILYILSSFIKALGGKVNLSGDQQQSGQMETKLSTANNFLFLCQLDNLNLFKVLSYCQKSLISRKLNGFVEKFQNSEVTLAEENKQDKSKVGVSSFLQEITQKIRGETTPQSAVSTPVKSTEDHVVMRSPLMHIEGFLLALTNADKDGRIVITKQMVFSQSSLKYLLLNPALHFSEIAREARSVIVAGGTMQPVSDFKEQLFHSVGIQPCDILEYSCGHVIPSENLLAVSLAKGPSGYNLDFTFQSRENSKLLNELGMLIQNVCQIVPGGVVCFFPSYDYQRLVLSHWEKTGTLLQIGKRKRVFQEPKKAGQVDMVLGEFSTCIRKCQVGTMLVGGMTGGILFCVVGGKMSEGINFSDDLGRCVMMVGLPYPNIKSPELQEKMTYLNSNYPRASDGRLPGQVHYENLCMKAVNQSIGRAIRHRNDYATILLLDQRYSRPNVSTKLPDWIRKCLQNIEKFGPTASALSHFFAAKK